MRSRAGTKWSQAVRQKHQAKRKNSPRRHISLLATKGSQIPEQGVEDIMAMVNVVRGESDQSC